MFFFYSNSLYTIKVTWVGAELTCVAKQQVLVSKSARPPVVLAILPLPHSRTPRIPPQCPTPQTPCPAPYGELNGFVVLACISTLAGITGSTCFVTQRNMRQRIWQHKRSYEQKASSEVQVREDEKIKKFLGRLFQVLSWNVQSLVGKL